MDNEKRKHERNQVWPETVATLEFTDSKDSHPNGLTTMTCRVDNLSVSGMYVFSDVSIPLDTNIAITIDFEPGQQPPNVIQALGVVVRQDDQGMAIEFTDIDAQFLGQCILAKLNSVS